MFIHQRTHHPHGLRSRIGIGLLALSSAFAIGFAILIVALLSAGRTTASTSATTAAPSYIDAAVIAKRRPCYFRDPATHALLRIPRHHGRCSKRAPGGA
jgi:hypothetical protein